MIEKKYSDAKPAILVVDDEHEISEMIARHLTFLGYGVETRDDGQKALELMREKRFEVVIMDIVMPVMNGIDLLREIRKSYPMTHCIMITGYVTLDNALSCLRLGADTCIFKPIENMTELENAVQSAVDRLRSWQNKLKQLVEMKPKRK